MEGNLRNYRTLNELRDTRVKLNDYNMYQLTILIE